MVNVITLFVVAGFGLNVAVTSVGSTGAERVTDPANAPAGTTVIGDVMTVP